MLDNPPKQPKPLATPLFHYDKGMVFDANHEIVLVVMEDHDIDAILEKLNRQ